MLFWLSNDFRIQWSLGGKKQLFWLTPLQIVTVLLPSHSKRTSWLEHMDCLNTTKKPFSKLNVEVLPSAFIIHLGQVLHALLSDLVTAASSSTQARTQAPENHFLKIPVKEITRFFLNFNLPKLSSYDSYGEKNTSRVTFFFILTGWKGEAKPHFRKILTGTSNNWFWMV